MGKVGQLSKRKRVVCWSIYIISLWFQGSGGGVAPTNAAAGYVRLENVNLTSPIKQIFYVSRNIILYIAEYYTIHS